jgi:hypothetical protein
VHRSESSPRLHPGFAWLREARFEIGRTDQVEALSGILAAWFPEPGRAAPGVVALLLNAVEHGNLEFGSVAKQDLLLRGTWEEELHRRTHHPILGARRVQIWFASSDRRSKVEIVDEGPGFDWRSRLNGTVTDPLERSGRGIYQIARRSFDGLRYNDRGNAVTAWQMDPRALKLGVDA